VTIEYWVEIFTGFAEAVVGLKVPDWNVTVVGASLKTGCETDDETGEKGGALVATLTLKVCRQSSGVEARNRRSPAFGPALATSRSTRPSSRRAWANS